MYVNACISYGPMNAPVHMYHKDVHICLCVVADVYKHERCECARSLVELYSVCQLISNMS